MAIYKDNPLQTLLSIKSKIKFFKSLSNDDIKNLIEEIKITTFKKGQLLFREGSTESLYVLYLLQGSISIYKKDETSQKDTLINTVNEPMILGELHFLTGNPRNATVKCGSDNTLVLAFKLKKLSYNTFEAQFYKSAIVELTKKLEHMNNKFKKTKTEIEDHNLIIQDKDDLFESLLYIKKDLPFFHAFSDTYIRKLVRDVQLIEKDTGFTLFKQGTINSRYVYILINGTVDIIKIDEHKNENVIHTIKEPTLFGEFHILTGNPRDATVRTSSDNTILLAIQIIEFQHKSLENRFYRNITYELAKKIESMNQNL